MKWFILLHCHKLSCSCCIFLHSISLSNAIYIQLFLNINRDVSELVKFATRSGLVSYVGKVVAPGDWDSIIRNVIFRDREGKSFYNIHKSGHFGCPQQTNSQKLHVQNTVMTARKYSKIEFSFRFCFIQPWLNYAHTIDN